MRSFARIASTGAASTSRFAPLSFREYAPDELGIDLAALDGFLCASGPIAVIDFETTGLSTDPAAEPIEVGAVLLDAGSEQVIALESPIRPRRPVPRVVRALTGIEDADLRGAPAVEEVAAPLSEALEGRLLIAHNAEFERHFLVRFVSPRFREGRYLDSQDLLAIAHPDAPDLRLETLARALLGREERHRALSDALDLAGVLSHVATGARSGDPRYAVVRDALERFDAASPWLPLLGAAGLPEEEVAFAQFVSIAPTHEKPVPFDADAIAAALSDEARGRRHLPGYRVRDEQIRMAREFARVLDEGGRLLLEGGTGVGKSLAYLAALIPFAMERAAGGIREPLIVSTRTKLLQDQLLHKDIPAAAAMLGHSGLRALSIKGRANYACARRCRQVLAEGSTTADLFPRDRLAFAALATCAQLRPHGEIGTLPGALLFRFPALRDLRRRAVASRAEHCTREQCASERACPFGRRRAALGQAHLVVSNHDLLLRWPPDYPRFTHVVIDEAHELTGVADEVYAREVRPEAVLERFDDLFGRAEAPRRTAPPPLVSERDARGWRRDLQQEFAALGRAMGERASEFGEVQLPLHAQRQWPEQAALASTAAQRIELAATRAESLAGATADSEASSEAIDRAVAELRGAAECLRAAFEDVGDDFVASFEDLVAPFDRWRLALRRVSPARTFHENFLDGLESLACVSASLFVGGDAFAALGELEIGSHGHAPVWSAALPSPFPYAQHMRTVALDSDGELAERTAEILAAIARQLGGRTLGLFTSLRRMREVHERLSDTLRGEGLDLLMPRRATDDPAALVQRFQRARGAGVLLGARTFWQGVDIAGNALQAVVIEKLPFEVPNELRRRREARVRDEGGDPFERYTLGKMLLNLKQMIGRLIRSEEDRGVVVIVDARRDRRYFERLAEALPEGCTVETLDREGLLELMADLGLTQSTQARDERRG
jgi:ATP-dependent DNA helicase DinG